MSLPMGADPTGQDGSGDTPLFPAIENGDAPMGQMLLEMRADPNGENEYRYLEATPLKLAMHQELGVIIWLLVEKGAGLPS
ncbi:NACHT domain-containing protein [Penicillium sp. IBT 18751x]|nr:NACHT domain-containing protein [Penicillium sp. IBT 18751x]